MRQIYNHYIPGREEIMISTKVKVEDVFGDVMSKDSISIEQITKLKIFFSQNAVHVKIIIKVIFFT